MDNRVPSRVEGDRASSSFRGTSLLSSSRSLTFAQRYKRIKRQLRDAYEASKFPTWEATSKSNWAPISLQTWTLDSSFRRFLLRLIFWQVFQWFFTLAICANVVALAMVSPRPGFETTPLAHSLYLANLFFIGAFTVEALIKITAMGFVSHKYSYLRDHWNKLDLFIVCVCYLEFSPVGNYSFMRILRLLRLMRVLSRFQELNAIFVAIVRSLPGLWVICLLAFFYFTIFGIVCLELFKGLLSYRCMSPDFTNAYLDEDNVTLLNVSYNSLPLDTSQQAAQVCKGPKAENITWSNSSGLPATGPFPNSGVQSWGFSCPWVPTDNPWAYWYPYGGYGPNDPSGNNYASGLTCASWGNPDIGGFRNFDNILFTWIQLFQHTLMQDWSFVMFNTQGAVSYWTWVLHIGMVIIGGFILVNLTVAVVFLNFSRHYSKPEDDYENEDEEVLIESKLEVKDGKLASTARTEDLLLHAEGNDDGTVSQGRTSLLKRLRGRGIWKATRRIAFAIQASKYFERLTTLVIVLNSIAMACVWYGQPQKSLQVQEIANYVFTGYFVVEMLIKHLGLGIKAYWKDGFNVFDGIVTIIGVIEVIVTLVGSANSTALMIFRMLRLLRIFRLARNWTSLQRIITVLINSLMSSFWIIVLLVFYMFSFGLLGQTFFGYKLDVCSVGNQVCPNGISLSDCPDHLNCYVDCSELEFGTWIDVNGSPYNNQAYCEAFGSNITYSLVNGTRTYTFGNDTQFIAQVGLPSITNPNYDSLYNAFLAMFVILTQDNYDTNMKTVMLLVNPWLGSLFYIFTMIIGILVVLNLFIAIILSGLSDMEELDYESTSRKPFMTSVRDFFTGFLFWRRGDKVAPEPEEPEERLVFESAAANDQEAKDEQPDIVGHVTVEEGAKSVRSMTASSRKPLSEVDQEARNSAMMRMQAAIERVAAGLPPLPELEGRSLFIFSSKGWIRKRLQDIINNEYFEYVMVFFIMASCIELCFYDVTLVPGSTKAKILYSFDIVFLIVFGIEAVMKIIHTGFLFNGKWSYLRNPWNILDLVVIAAMILVMVLEGKVGSRDIVWLRALRAFRALRSMKVATKLDGMRAVVRSMGLAIPAVLEVLLVASLFYFIFSILGVNLLGGKLFFCAQVTPGQPPQPSQYMDPHYFLANGMNINSSWCNAGEQNITTSWYHSGLVLLQPFPSYTVTTTWGANVQTSTSPIYNLRFDNTYQSLWVLISMTSLENWSPLMYQAMTVTDVEFQPILSPPPSPYLAFFFVFFVFFCVFFVLSLVISVCIDKFNKFRQLTGGRNLLLTEEQQQWLRVQHIMLTIKPKKKVVIPSNPIRSFCYRLSMTEAFDRFMIAIILLNVVVMLMPHEGQGEKWDAAFAASNAAFTGIFVVEMVLRWTAMGLPQYFADGWCRFDFVVVVVSLVGVFMDYFSSANTTILPILRALRVLRIFKLVPRLKSLRQMLLTILYALPALFNVGMVLFLFLYLYAILGINLFGNVMLQNTLNQYVNFQTFTSAMLLLFRSITGENWNAVMSDMMVLNDCIMVAENIVITNATDNSTIATLWSGQYLDSYGDQVLISQIPSSALVNQCSISPTLAAFYFSTFMLVCTFLILQLVIGIIIESIELQYANDRLPINEKHIDAFVETWNSLDVRGTNFIDAVYLTTILDNVPHPMGVKGLKGRYKSDKLTEIIYTCDIPMRDQRINFLETLLALSYRVAGAEIPEEDNDNLIQRMKEVLNHEQHLPPADFTVAHLYACLYVKGSIQGFLVRHSLRPIFSRYKEYESELDALRMEARSNRHLAGAQGARSMRKLLRSGSPSPFTSGNKLAMASVRRNLPPSLAASMTSKMKPKAEAMPAPPTQDEPAEDVSLAPRTLKPFESHKSLFAQISQSANLHYNGDPHFPPVGGEKVHKQWKEPEELPAAQSSTNTEGVATPPVQSEGLKEGKRGRRHKLPSLMRPPSVKPEDSVTFPKLTKLPLGPDPALVASPQMDSTQAQDPEQGLTQ